MQNRIDKPLRKQIAHCILHLFMLVFFKIPQNAEIKLLCCQSGLKVNFKQCTVGRIRKIAACAEHKRARNTEMSEQHLPEFFINGLALFLFLLDFCRILRRRAGISAFLGISGFICGIFPGKWLAGFCFFTLFGCICAQNNIFERKPHQIARPCLVRNKRYERRLRCGNGVTETLCKAVAVPG